MITSLDIQKEQNVTKFAFYMYPKEGVLVEAFSISNKILDKDGRHAIKLLANKFKQLQDTIEELESDKR